MSPAISLPPLLPRLSDLFRYGDGEKQETSPGLVGAFVDLPTIFPAGVSQDGWTGPPLG